MVERKAFLACQKNQYHASQCGEQIVVPITKNNQDYYEFPICLISWMNINYGENGEKKPFSCKSKAPISCIPMWRR